MGGRTSKVHPAPVDVKRSENSNASVTPQDGAKHCVLMVGNPGSGKSLLLNSLMGKPLFLSGFSAGHGLTVKLDIRKHNGIQYIDTPGLADAHLRKEAATSITDALRQQGWYKLVLVATLEDWNFRPQDKITLELILDAIQKEDLTNKYAIVINKVPKECGPQIELFSDASLTTKFRTAKSMDDKEYPDKVVISKLKSLHDSFFGTEIAQTDHVIFLREQNVEDSLNGTLELPGEFEAFINTIPEVFLDPAKNVTKVQISKYADRLEQLRSQEDRLKQEKEELRAKLWRLRVEQGIAQAEEETGTKETPKSEEMTAKALQKEEEKKIQEEFPQGAEVLLLTDADFDGIKVAAGAEGRVTTVSNNSLKVKMDDSRMVIAVPQQKRHLICKKADKQRRKELKVHELAHRGITLEALLDFYGKLLYPKEDGFVFKPQEHTTAEVVQNVLIPMTSKAAKSYAEVAHSASGGVKATRMVSHNWGNLFTHLMAAIVADALDTDFFAQIAAQLVSNFNGLYEHLRFTSKLGIHYWVCSFSVNQHVTGCKYFGCPCMEQSLTNLSPLCEVDKFDQMMELIFEQGEEHSRKDTRHVVAVDKQCRIFKRAWVVAELVVALTLKTAVTQKYKFLDEESIRTLKLKKIDVTKCVASRTEDVTLVLNTAKDRIAARGHDWREFHGKLYEKVFGQVQQDMLNKKAQVLYIGDKGVGKTYLLNKMKGQKDFADEMRRQQAQAATGSEDAVDMRMDSETSSTTTYVYKELGGLSDPRTTQQAAKAITEALKDRERHRLFIVVTSETGRVRPDDAELLRKVLEAAPAIGPNYNVIVNKVDPGHGYQIYSPKNRKDIAKALFTGLPPPFHSEYIWFVEKGGKLPPRMLEDAVEASLGPGAVHRISIETEEAKAKKLQADVKGLEEEKKLLQEDLQAAQRQKEEGGDMPVPKWIGTPLQGHIAAVSSVAVSSDGQHLVSGSDRTIRIWEMSSGKQQGEPIQGHTDEINSVAISPDGRLIFSGSMDNTIRVWNMITGEQLGEPLTGHSAPVRSVAVSPDGQHLVSGSNDETIRVWELSTGKQSGEPLTGHTKFVRSVATTPDGQRIVSGSNDETIRIWDMSTGKQLGEPLTGHTNFVISVAVSPDGKKIVSGSNDQTVRIWDMSTREQLGQALAGHTNFVVSIAISRDGKSIISGSWDSTIRVWQLSTGKQLGETLRGHADSVNSVAISPDGKHILSGSDDRTIRAWPMAGEHGGLPQRR